MAATSESGDSPPARFEGMTMDTPLYPPAQAFEQPVTAPYVLSVEGCSVAELKSVPEAWAVLLKHMPSIRFVAELPVTQKLLGEMTVVDFSTFSAPIDPRLIATIDAELGKLPAALRPAR